MDELEVGAKLRCFSITAAHSRWFVGEGLLERLRDEYPRTEIIADAMKTSVAEAAEKHGGSKWTIYDWLNKEKRKRSGFVGPSLP